MPRPERFAAIRLQERHLELLTSLAAAIAHSADLDTVLSTALDGTLQAIEIEAGAIYLADPETGELRLTSHVRGVPAEYVEAVSRFQSGEALLGRRLDVPTVVPDLAAAPEAREATRKLGLRSMVFVPLYARGRMVGVMPLGGFEKREFPADELRLLETVGGLLGGAIESSRLLARTRRHLDQVQALWEIDRAIVEDRELDQVLNTIAKEAATLGGGDAAIALLEGEEGELRVGGSCGLRALSFLEARTEPETLGPVRDLLLGGVPQTRRLDAPGSIRSLALIIPLRAGARALGGLVVVKPEDELREDDLTLLSTFAHQAAVALVKARVRDAEGRRAGQLALVSAAAEIAASTLDLDALLGSLARYILRSLGYYGVAVYLVEPEERVVRLVGAAGSATLARGRHLRFGQGIIGWVAERGEYVLANDVSREPRFVRGGMEATQAELAVPVKLSGEVVAVIDVQSDRAFAFDEGDMVTVDAIASQVASAVRNARLFQEKVRALRNLEILQEITNVLNSDLDLDALLERIARRSVEAVRPSQMGAVLLHDGDGLRVRSSWGFPAAAVLSRVRLDLHEGLPGAVFVNGLGRVAERQVDLGRASAAFHEAAGGTAPLSALCVPISLPGEKLGVLLLHNCTSAAAFDADALRFASTLGHQAAIAMGNALRLQRILELDRQRKDYLSNVSHELRTPLTVVQGYVEALADGTAGDQAPQFLRVAHEQCQRLARMIDEVLEVARLEQGTARQPVRWEPIDLADTVRRVVRGIEGDARSKELRLTERVAAQVPRLSGDARLLQLLIQNLLENAVKFTPAGGSVEAELSADDEYVRLSVSDTGIGISSEYHDKVFEKFFTVDAGPSRSHGGAGIGLYLAREVASIHSGSICVESRPEGGSRFEVRLPVRPPGARLDGEETGS